MEENILEVGLKIKWMEKEYSNGLMVEFTKEIIMKIWNKVKVVSYGLMENDMLVSGSTENSMAEANISSQMGDPKKENGKQELEFVG